MAFTERERQILVGVDLEAQTADEGALQAFAESCQDGGGGSSLPAVTTDDNGKLLGVDDGEWGALANYKPCFVFGFTVESDGHGGYAATADAGSTYAAIKAALAITDMVIADVVVLGQHHRAIISDRDRLLYATATIYNSTLHAPLLIQLDIDDDDELYPLLIVLAVAST